MRLYLVRHPRPDIAPGICYGSSDLAVPEQEHERALAAVIAALPQGAPMYASSLRRCREFAARLAKACGSARVIHDERLAEMHFGAWEMCAWDDIPRAEIDAWAADPVFYRPGGGENVLQVAHRIRSFHASLRSREEEHAVVVCHAGTIRLLLGLLLACCPGAPLEEIALHAATIPSPVAYGGLLVLDD